MGEIQRHKVLMDLLEGSINARRASELLRLSYIHTSRLKKKVKEEGIEGLIRRSGSGRKKVSEAKKKVIAGLYEDIYSDFNILHFKGSIICESMLLKGNKSRKKEEKIEQLLSRREYAYVGVKI